MMYKNFSWPLLTMFLASAFAFASLDEVDLSGTWRLAENDDNGSSSIINFVKTPIHSHLGGTLYIVQGSVGEWWYVWAASIEHIHGQNHLVWWAARGSYFDGESNIILASSETWLSLGSDVESYEVATLERIGDGSEFEDGAGSGNAEGGGGADPTDPSQGAGDGDDQQGDPSQGGDDNDQSDGGQDSNDR
jgi:hypothetical protein